MAWYVVIGSGATAMTLVPSMADEAEHVTMLQRSPTYVVSLPDRDRIANTLRKFLPDMWAYKITRFKNVEFQKRFYQRTRTAPDRVKKFLLDRVRKAIGDEMVEKHFTLSRQRVGPDHRASLDVAGLQAFVSAVRNVERCLGDGIKRPMPSELGTRDVARKSLVATRRLEPGSVLSPRDLTAKRPGTGIPPKELPRLIGRRLRSSVDADALLEWSHLA